MLNAAQVAYNDAFSMVHDQIMAMPAFSGVLTNDTDGDSDPLSAIQVSSPSHGSLTLQTDGGFSYQPDSGYTGSDSFTYKANDGAVDSNTVTVTFTITNTAPTAWGNTVPLDVSHSGQTDPIDLSQYSSDGDFDQLEFTIVAEPTHGQVSLDENGCYVYTPDLDYTGQDSFSFIANDGVVDSNTATYSFNVTNSTPSAWDNTTPLDVLHNVVSEPIDLSQFSSDADEDFLVFTVSQPSHGQVYALGGSMFVYVADEGYTGEDSFTFQGDDGAATTSTATFTVDVTNTAPTVTDTSVYQILKNGSITISNLSTYGADASTMDLEAEIVVGPEHGELDDLGGGVFTYTADTDYVGSDSFTISFHDGIDESEAATVSINVFDGAITANDGRKAFSGLVPIVISASELLASAQSTQSSPNFQVTNVATPDAGSIVDNQDGTWTYTPPADALAGFEGAFVFTITDGVNTDTANFTLLVPDRQPAEEQHDWRRAQDQRLFLTVNVTQLFPAGFNAATYNGLPNATKIIWNEQFAASIHQGLVSGDSSAAAAMAAAIRKQGFTHLTDNIAELRNGNNELTGYAVTMGNGQQVNIGLISQKDKRIFGASYSNDLPASLWYTVFERAYIQQFRGPAARITFTTIGDFYQPVPTRAAATPAILRASGIESRSVGVEFLGTILLIDQLETNAMMIAATKTSFSPTEQTTADEVGISAAHCYAIVGYNALTSRVELQNPHNGPGIGGRIFDIALDEFQLLFDFLTHSV